MPDPLAAMRERLEKWAKTPRENEWHWEEWAFERGASGEYLGASVDSAWAAWQASLPSEAGIEAVARRKVNEILSPDPNNPDEDTYWLQFPHAVELVECREFWRKHLAELFESVLREALGGK